MIEAIVTWSVKPALFELFGREIRWYSVLFALGFLIGYKIIEKMFKHEKIRLELLDKMFIYVFIATVVGARLGHCLFYDFSFYMAHPIEILKVWEGGLASHGGAIGILIAMWIFAKKQSHQSFVWGLDRLIVPVALVGAMIRLGNLMNHEIYGHPTEFPWAFRFVENVGAWQRGAEARYSLPSHPTQLYEASLYLITFAILFWGYWKKEWYKKEGLLFGVFLIGIFASRFFVEFLKNNQESFEDGMFLNMGQLLSIPFILAGVYYIWNALRVNPLKR